MTNFLLGLAAGSLIACIATISALRHPDVQERLGLVPPVHAALAHSPSRVASGCPVPAKQGSIRATAEQADALFARRRFWYVSP